MALAAVSLTVSPAWSQQDGPKTLSSGNSSGIFCGYEPSESGDSPDSISVKKGQKISYLSAGMKNQDEWYLIQSLKIDAPITYEYEVVNYYNESGGERETTTFITKFKVSGEPVPGSCQGAAKR
ncbi:MAG: hypothetical protein LBP22_02905 [Deltaproteobacteria bacterium]|nr:hypothetical protein [Deltaproteobacteria bacterium]